MKYHFVLAAFFAAAAFSAPTPAATYADLFDANAHITITDHSVQIADVERDATPCAATAPYICVQSPAFSFAVPKDPTKTAWEFEGNHFQVVGHDEGAIFGSKARYRIIRISGRNNFTVIYSDERGVLALKDRSGHLLLIAERCGFARLHETAECSNSD